MSATGPFLSSSSSDEKQVILITGDRNWKNFEVIKKSLTSYINRNTLLIHGDCRGADRIAGHVGLGYKFVVDAKPADWKRYGKAAGILRNIEMIDMALKYKQQGISTVVLAFHEHINESKGTKHCIEYAKKAGLKVLLNDSRETREF